MIYAKKARTQWLHVGSVMAKRCLYIQCCRFIRVSPYSLRRFDAAKTFATETRKAVRFFVSCFLLLFFKLKMFLFMPYACLRNRDTETEKQIEIYTERNRKRETERHRQTETERQRHSEKRLQPVIIKIG